MKDNKAEESLRELLNGDPDLKAAFKETIEEMQKPENIEKGNYSEQPLFKDEIRMT